MNRNQRIHWWSTDSPHKGTAMRKRSHVITSSSVYLTISLIARFMETTWGPSGADRTQVGPMLAPWTLLSGMPLTYKIPLCPTRLHMLIRIPGLIFFSKPSPEVDSIIPFINPLNDLAVAPFRWTVFSLLFVVRRQQSYKGIANK